MLEKTKGAIKNDKSRETGNTGHTRQKKTKNTTQYVTVGHHYKQTITNNVNKT
jgi:hypothetical protein